MSGVAATYLDSSNYEETADDIQRRKQLQDDYNQRVIELTTEQEEFIHVKLSSKRWRLNNLYKIRDKAGKLITLRFNKAQHNTLINYRHNKKIILKSRQQGISTLFLAYNLDSCLFIPGYQAGIQSYGLDETSKLQTRAQLMWDGLDSNVKELMGLKLVSNNAKGMTFSNGSILKIGNFRGDTLQSLHVSELAKISKKYPEKAKELKTGAFQAVSVDNKITIESTAEGRTGLFFEMWQKATQRAASSQPLTPLDFQPIFLSWIDDPDCNLYHEYPIMARHEEYFAKLTEELNMGGTIDDYEELGFDRPSLTDSQKYWAAAKMEELGEDFDQEYPATPDRAFAASVEGTYFKHQYNRLANDKRIGKFPYNPSYPVYVSLDIGVNDEHVMVFFQVIGGVPRQIDEHHMTGEGIEYYAGVLKKLPYFGNYGTFFFPHDMNVTDYSTGRTRLETFRKEGITRIRLLNKLSFADSIEAARQLIDIMEIDDGCENSLLALQNYRKKYDKRLGVYLDTDEHDIHSNYAAALRYMAQGLSIKRVKRTQPKTSREIHEERYQDYQQKSSDFAI